ncbi:sulfite exporter TauE/SafE family protein [Brevibacillus agri]|uniref:sulfite exporter TauE/SafE family protein n=1 Tax=Brevibacillus TaxID=55080 RepID=UPI002E202AFA|nr:sulfite exporter TauE/SafE family protein [Brevibacillus agri]MED1657504.1 sulfite exporter TauE/SafE family protein [Brevibacillus agri]MED1690108.1 sulfite exporter TauE/SafE family protein [Brevibacillus agri]MED1694424.1 sulfite exporter TauE/SafE family protein [Brevibacillus agri]MED1700286.1 sulfite exporter TauE/SafE family protein [Brevibacillus agri]
MDWYYSFINQIGVWFSGPITDLYYGMGEQVPLMGALLLGIIGAFAPCQLTGNVAAFTVFGRNAVTKGTFGSYLFLFILGKALVYSALGSIVFLFGEQLSTQAIPLFQWARKLIAPLLVLVGLMLVGWIRLPFLHTQTFTGKMEQFARRFQGRVQSFLLGFTFSLGFCPTMFWLFFGLAMPLMLSSSTGPLIPAVFALGTALPLMVVLLVLSIASDRTFILKKARKLGHSFQKIAGVMFILLGISDFLTFW